MSDLVGYLERILEWHRQHGCVIPRIMQEGLSEGSIRNRLSRLPFKMPKEYNELYAWRNGSRTQGLLLKHISFVEYHFFLTADEGIDDYNLTHDILREYHEIADWIPLFQDGTGDGYGLHSISDDQNSGKVVFYFKGMGANIVFRNLTMMMKTIVTCIQDGVFAYEDKEDGHSIAFDKMRNICREMNPEIDYWKSQT